MKFIFLFICFIGSFAQADCTLGTSLNGVVSAATRDYLERAEKEAQKQACQSLLIRINTPGGDLQATRLIVEKILASPIPYLCLISPSGGHAGSAGALILQACHVSGGVGATNVGAATPILGSGQTLSEDLRKKIVNDTVSWSQSLAKLRGRNLDFAKEIVTDAKAMSTEDAVKAGALDFFVRDEKEFLELAKNKKVQVGDEKDQAVVTGEIREFATDLRYQILNFVTDPELAYILFMASLALLYFEITHPGFVAPGVFGGIGLIFSLIAFHKLEVQWGGLALIVFGIVCLIAEVFVPSFGILGIGGVAALIVGSLFLYDAQIVGYVLPLSLILTVSLLLGALFLTLGFLALKTMRRGKKELDSDMIGRLAPVVRKINTREGQLEVLGETWSFVCQGDFLVGDQVRIKDREGLILKVEKEVKEWNS